MANADRPVGFTVAEGQPYFAPKPYVTAASETIAIGDMVSLDSAGRVTIATSSTAIGLYLGVAASSVTSSSAGDEILVYDNPATIFQGQCSGDGALTDPYTTRSLAACFDIEGTTGIMEINEDSTTYDVCKIIGIGTEPNGEESAVGTNQKKLFKIALGTHVYGVLA